MPTDAQIEAARVMLRDKYRIWLSPIALKAALAAAEAAAWQPIESAPKDDTWIQIGWVGQKEIVIALGRWACAEVLTPTHWRPLPDPPLKPASGGEA